MSARKGRKKSHREQGESEDRGVTKSIILIYVADWTRDQGPDEDDIRLHLRNELNITRNDLVSGHLADLTREKYLVAKQDASGRTYYTMGEGFECFKRLFNFVHESGRIIGFMETRYCQHLLMSEVFELDLLINMVRNGVLYMSRMTEQYQQFIDISREARQLVKKSSVPDLTKNVIGVFSDINRAGTHPISIIKPRNGWSDAILQAIEFFKTHDTDDIHNVIHGRSVMMA